MRKISSLFLFWVTLLALFVSVTGVLADLDLSARIFQLLFIPVTLYLVFSLISHLLTHAPALDRKDGWKRLIIYYCFIVTTTLVAVSFLSSQTLPQFASAAIFSPLAVYFLFLIWPQRKIAVDLGKISKSERGEEDLKAMLSPTTKLDVDRRDFLKLIGAAGIMAFIFSLFTRKATAPFFSNVTDIGAASLRDSGGNKIDPAEKSPTDGYYITEIDDDQAAAYFGFVNKAGAWFIMREDESDAYRYTRGDANFPGNWAGRASLRYDYFGNVF